jgi:hypothetical protein
MPPLADPAALTTQQRFEAVARLLALGLRRLPSCRAVAGDPAPGALSDGPQKSSLNCLDDAADLRLSVHTG